MAKSKANAATDKSIGQAVTENAKRTAARTRRAKKDFRVNQPKK